MQNEVLDWNLKTIKPETDWKKPRQQLIHSHYGKALSNEWVFMEAKCFFASTLQIKRHNPMRRNFQALLFASFKWILCKWKSCRLKNYESSWFCMRLRQWKRVEKPERESARDGNGGRKERGSEMERVLSKRYMHTNSDGKEGQQMLSIECHKFIVFIICSEAAVNCLQFFFFVFLFCSLFPQFFFLSILSFCVSLFSASLGESQ